jgi:hypothetical protein
MKKQHIITSASAHTRIANLVVEKVKNAVSFFSDAQTVEIDELRTISWYKVIVVSPKNSPILTFAEIDTVREVVDKFCKKYKGMGYVMDTRLYLAKDGKTFLHMPVMEISVRRYCDE